MPRMRKRPLHAVTVVRVVRQEEVSVRLDIHFFYRARGVVAVALCYTAGHEATCHQRTCTRDVVQDLDHNGSRARSRLSRMQKQSFGTRLLLFVHSLSHPRAVSCLQTYIL